MDKIQWLNTRSLFLIIQQSRKILDHWQSVTRPIPMEGWGQKLD